MTNAGVRRGKKGAVRTRLGLPVSLTVAVLPHADDRGRVAAALAAQRQVAYEGVLADARAAKQEHPSCTICGSGRACIPPRYRARAYSPGRNISIFQVHV